MKKIIYSVALLAVVMLAGCSKNFEDMNTNPKQPTDVPSAYLLTSAQKNLTDILTSSNVNSNVFRLWTQHWTETTYFDESRYDVVTRLIAANFWTPLYRDVLKDLDACKAAIAADPKITDKSVKASQTAIADILEVYTYSVLLETYGNVPYGEAMDITNLQPKYDDALTTYKDLFKRLDADITDLKAGSASFAAGDSIRRLPAGRGGAAGAAAASNAGGGPSGIPTGGDLNIYGAGGFSSIRASAAIILAGNGAPSHFGGGGRGAGVGGGSGENALVYGAGGGGATAAGANQAGGTGGDSLIEIWEFY